MIFQTDFKYTDRKSKHEYVWLKYHPILRGRKILDVGADECYLKKHLDENATYLGIGKGGHPDRQIDLEQEKIPFSEKSFDCVLCLDVLEHVENIHQIFDECCRVSREHVIICLPNAWADFYNMLRFREYRPGQAMKFYGLPLEPPEDRHKWFFSYAEAEKFINYRAGKNGMLVKDIDKYGVIDEGRGLRRLLRGVARAVLFREDLNFENLYTSALWTVLEKTKAN